MTTTTDPIQTAALSFASLPALGSKLDGGTFHGITTLKDGTHCAVVKLDVQPPGRMPWGQAKAWAEEVGGQLPTRAVAALLYANAKDQFEKTWYWTSETLDADTGDEDDASYAWYCDFNHGNQDNSPARATKAVPCPSA